MIYRILQEQPTQTIVYASNSTQRVYVIPPEGPIWSQALGKYVLSDIDSVLGVGEDPVLITDAVLAPELPFPTVFIVSAGMFDRDQTNKLNSYRPMCYMPTPTEAEVRRMFKVVSNGRDDDEDFNKRMKLWGPNPRLVIANISEAHQAEALRLRHYGSYVN
jgi:hypothetical protein